MTFRNTLYYPKIGTRLLLFVLLLGIVPDVSAQDAKRFQSQVDAILKRSEKYDKEDLVIFTGSSSIRRWESLQSTFPGYNVVNHGFGGSKMVDLLFYIDELILRHDPVKLFIYEGDNDTNARMSPTEIIHIASEVLEQVRSKYPTIPIYFLAAKPSIKRWPLREKYRAFNKKLENWTKEHENTYFIDVWTPMVENGDVKRDLFIEDGVHLNSAGYQVWSDVIGPLVK